MTTTKRPLFPLLLGLGIGACAEANDPATSDPAALGTDPAPMPPPGTTAAPAQTPPPTVAATDMTAPPPVADPAGEVMGAAGSACNTTDFTPKCDLAPTAAGAEIKKGTACTEADPQCCFRTCGPQSIGWKTETCIAGAYEEGDCQFPPDADYSCYKIPAAIDATVCPQDGPPQSGQDCTVAECTLCNLDDTYLDSGGSSKVGYCVCQAPNGEGKRTWSCGSTTAWPCPLGQGC